MNDMINRVARAIEDAAISQPISNEDMGFISCAYMNLIARAAIEAMREPTEAMVEACDRFRVGIHLETRDAWTVMIDEALK